MRYVRDSSSFVLIARRGLVDVQVSVSIGLEGLRGRSRKSSLVGRSKKLSKPLSLCDWPSSPSEERSGSPGRDTVRIRMICGLRTVVELLCTMQRSTEYCTPNGGAVKGLLVNEPSVNPVVILHFRLLKICARNTEYGLQTPWPSRFFALR